MNKYDFHNWIKSKQRCPYCGSNTFSELQIIDEMGYSFTERFNKYTCERMVNTQYEYYASIKCDCYTELFNLKYDKTKKSYSYELDELTKSLKKGGSILAYGEPSGMHLVIVRNHKQEVIKNFRFDTSEVTDLYDSINRAQKLLIFL